MILFCNLVCVYVRKMCEGNFDSCKNCFHDKVRKKTKRSMPAMRVAMMPITQIWTRALCHGMAPHHSKTSQYSNRIRSQ